MAFRPARTHTPHPLAFQGTICVPVLGSCPEEFSRRVATLAPEMPFLELRLDYLPDPLAAVWMLEGVLRQHPKNFFLATCRPERSGGRFPGSAADELAVLTAAADAGVPLIDLSLETAEELGPTCLDQLRSHGAAVLLSFHDFQKTGDLEAVLTRMRHFGPDLCKLVPTATSLADSLDLLQTLQNAGSPAPSDLVAIAMGEPGLLTRVLGPRFGSAFTFAAVTEAEATAPGQLTATTLAGIYRIADISSKTLIYGVAGDPIRSSLSPLMQNTAFSHAALDAVYLPLKTSDPEVLLRAARQLPLAGFSVTMPLKRTILPYLDHIDDLAARIGAVNTVLRRSDGSLHGFNTDADGIVLPLSERLNLRGARVLILGAGGAARAAVFGCLDQGASVFLSSRTQISAEALAQESGASALTSDQAAAQDFDVLIHATPAGMHGNPHPLPLHAHRIRANLVFDLVYNPLETPLLALARSQGLEVIPGIEMFIRQGARQFELWTGKSAPTAAMHETVLRALQSS